MKKNPYSYWKTPEIQYPIIASSAVLGFGLFFSAWPLAATLLLTTGAGAFAFLGVKGMQWVMGSAQEIINEPPNPITEEPTVLPRPKIVRKPSVELSADAPVEELFEHNPLKKALRDQRKKWRVRAEKLRAEDRKLSKQCSAEPLSSDDHQPISDNELSRESNATENDGFDIFADSESDHLNELSESYGFGSSDSETESEVEFDSEFESESESEEESEEESESESFVAPLKAQALFSEFNVLPEMRAPAINQEAEIQPAEIPPTVNEAPAEQRPAPSTFLGTAARLLTFGWYHSNQPAPAEPANNKRRAQEAIFNVVFTDHPQWLEDVFKKDQIPKYFQTDHHYLERDRKVWGEAVCVNHADPEAWVADLMEEKKIRKAQMREQNSKQWQPTAPKARRQ